MEWLHESVKYYTRKYCCYEATWGFQPHHHEKMYTWPQFMVEKQKVSYRWGGSLAQNPRGLYE
jgi:hypothetical protein